MARGAPEAQLRALAALGGERRARRHLLLLRSRRHDSPPGSQPWNVRTRLTATMCAGDVRFRRPTEADGCVLSRRRLDRRRAIASPLRHALVEPALVKHGIGEPNAAAHNEHEE